MSFFMVLPGLGDPVVCFDEMIQAARALSKELDAEIFDEQGSSWSIQRERYIREEIIEYRHQMGRA
jgi:cell division protein ZipA